MFVYSIPRDKVMSKLRFVFFVAFDYNLRILITFNQYSEQWLIIDQITLKDYFFGRSSQFNVQVNKIILTCPQCNSCMNSLFS